MGDMMWAAVALTGLAVLVQNRSVALLLGIVGTCFLLRQAVAAFRGAAHGRRERDIPAQARGDLITGSFFSLTKPFAVAFWLGLGAGVTATAHTGLAATVGFFAGFFVGAVIWCVGFATLVSVGRRHAKGSVLRAIDALAGVALTYFGIRLLWRTVSALRVLRLARLVVG
jgi:L-lysine exporter family protein LysE/ArgO